MNIYKLYVAPDTTQLYIQSVVSGVHARLVVDTGCTECLMITNEVAGECCKSQIRRPKKPDVIEGIGGNTTTLLPVVGDVTLLFEGGAQEHYPVDIVSLSLVGHPGSFDGMIGIKFLRKEKLAIDCARGVLLDARAVRKATKDVIRVEYRDGKDGFALVKVRVAGHVRTFMVDTGAAVTLLDATVFAAIASDTDSGMRAAGIGGASPEIMRTVAPEYAHHLLILEKSGLAIPLSRVYLLDMLDLRSSRDRVSGILGLDFLRAAGAIIDPASRSIFFSRM